MSKIQAKKHLGQNFLQDRDTIHKIVHFFDIEGKSIVEVWPWLGALTKEILQKNPLALHLVEFDRDMVRRLEMWVESWELEVEGIDFEILEQDVLKYIPQFQKYDVIANIPYYITSPILFHFLYDISNPPEKMTIMMQKEVGERILFSHELWVKSLEKNKKTQSSLLGLAMWKKCTIKRVCDVPKAAFYPVPKVDSIVLAFEFQKRYPNIDDVKFLDFLKMIFKEPRKTLQNNLVNGGYTKEQVWVLIKHIWEKETVRAEELSLDGVIQSMNFLELSQKWV